MVTLWTDGSVLAGEASRYAVWAVVLGRPCQPTSARLGWHGRPSTTAQTA